MYKIQWSYSSLKKYATCPKQFFEVKVLKNFTEPDTDATRYGKEVHTALEQYVLGKPLPLNYEMFEKSVAVLKAIPGCKYPEYKMALTKDHVPCDFDAPEYWVRGIADLVIIDGETAFCVDYKTGNDKYMDLKQLRLMAIMIMLHHPKVNIVKAGLLFLLKNRFVPEEYERKLIPALWGSFTADLKQLENSFVNNTWYPKQSGLCRRHCVVSTCEHHGGY
jgi:hypothetical protein